MTMPARGCGDKRVEGGLYLTVPTSPDGKPLEHFMVDPAIPWNGGQLRGPQLFSLPNEEVGHVVLGVGASFYPYACDYLEEVRVMGVSKRVSRNIDLSSLVPSESKLLLIHPRAIPEFNYTIRAYGQKIVKGQENSTGCAKDIATTHLCLSDTYPLSADPVFSSDKHQVKVVPLLSIRTIKTPSASYSVVMEEMELTPPLDYQAGIILRFPFFTFQFVSHSGAIPRKVAEKFESSSFDLEVVPE